MLRAAVGARRPALGARAFARTLRTSALVRDEPRKTRDTTEGHHGPSEHRPEETAKGLFHNYPRTLRNLALLQRRASQKLGASGQALRSTPTQEDLLRIARGFWTRMRIRFKWFTIRGFRRFNIDDFSAFFTLGGLGTAILVIVGTTTFVSAIFALLNVLNMQGA